MIKILLVGGNGYIGRCLTQELSKNDLFDNVVIIDKDISNSHLLSNHKIKFVKLDLFNIKKVYKIVSKFNINFILDLSSDFYPDEYKNNIINFYEMVIGKNISLFKVARYAHIKKIMFLSNIFFDDDSTSKNIFIEAKKSSEKMICTSSTFYDINCAIIRTTSIIGTYNNMNNFSKYNLISYKYEMLNKPDKLFQIEDFKYCCKDKNNFIDINDFCFYMMDQILMFFSKNESLEKKVVSQKWYLDSEIENFVDSYYKNNKKIDLNPLTFSLKDVDYIDQKDDSEKISKEIMSRKERW